MTSYTNIIGGNLVLPANNSYLAITLNSNTQLAWSSEFGNSALVVSALMQINPTVGGLSVTMPDATLASVGVACTIDNRSGFSFSLLTFGGTLIGVIGSGRFYLVYLDDNTTPIASNGIWRLTSSDSIAGGVVTQVGLNTSATNGNLTVTGTNPITSAGTFNLSFGAGTDLLALTTFGAGVGMAARTGAGVWQLRSFVSTANIIIANADGVAGNPVFNLAPNLGLGNTINAIIVGNLSIENNDEAPFGDDPQLSTLGAAKNIILSPSFTGFTGGGVLIGTTPALGFLVPLPVGVASLVFPVGGAAQGYVSLSVNPTQGNLATSYVFPVTAPNNGDVLSADTTSAPLNQLKWKAVATVPNATVAQTIPIYTNTTGTLGSSTLVITGDVPTPGVAPFRNIGGVRTVTFLGGLTIGTVGVNQSIVTSTSDITLQPPLNADIFLTTSGTGTVNIDTSITFYNVNNPSLASSIGQPDGLTSDIQYTLPIVAPSAVGNVLKISSLGPPFQWSWSSSMQFTDMSTAHIQMEGSAGPNNISVTGGDGTLHLIPMGGQSVHLHNGVIVRNNALLKLNNGGDTHYTSLQSHPLSVTDIQYVWPQFTPPDKGFMYVTGTANPFQLNFTTAPAFSSFATANLQFEGTAGNNTIAATNTNGPIILRSLGTGAITLGSITGTGGVQILNSLTLTAGAGGIFTSPTDNKTTTLRQIDGAAANPVFNLPLANPATNALLSSVGGATPYQMTWTTTPSVASLTTTNLTLDVVANTLSATNVNGSLNFTPNGTGTTNVNSQLNISNNAALRLLGNNFAVRVLPSTTTTVAYDITLPTAGPTAISQILRTSTSGNATLIWGDILGVNLLINSSMALWQRNTSITSATTFFPNNNGAYTADMWVLQSDGNNIVTAARSTTAPTGTAFDSRYSMLLSVITPTKKFGIAQFQTFNAASAITGKTVSISFVAQSLGLVNIRAAMLSWTGTANTLTNPIVTTWNASGTNPTLAAGWVYNNTPVNLTLTSGFLRYTVDNIAMTTPATNNTAIFIWVDDLPPFVGNTLYITSIKQEVGSVSTPFVAPLVTEDLLRAKRFFQKNFPIDTPVGSVTTWSAAAMFPTGGNVANTNTYGNISFAPEMQITPTVVTYPYTTVTNTGRASNNAGVDQAAATASLAPGAGTVGPTPSVDAHGFVLSNTSGGVLSTTNGVVIVNWYAFYNL